MKRYYFFALILSSLFIACQDGQGASSDGDDNKPESQKKISKRDYSINKDNSYSDLFMDSMVMERFIIDKKLNDSITRRMRSFYNTRNY